MVANLKNAAAIVGAAESNEIGYPEERGPNPKISPIGWK